MEKIISIILLAVIVSTSVLFTGCGGEVAPSNAQTSDEADTTALSDTTPTADPNQFSVEFYDYKTNELISKSNKNNLNEKMRASDDLIYMTSDNKVDSIDVEPSYVILLSYLKDTSRDIWVLIYVKGDDVYVQADIRHTTLQPGINHRLAICHRLNLNQAEGFAALHRGKHKDIRILKGNCHLTIRQIRLKAYP